MRGDDVLCELSPYDLNKGRITFRNTAASRRVSEAPADSGNNNNVGVEVDDDDSLEDNGSVIE